MKKKPRSLSLVRFSFPSLSREQRKKFPFKENGVYVFFGEIPNMPGHCVVADHKTGKILSGYHTEYFRELTRDEV